jgi:hypothetical protein
MATVYRIAKTNPPAESDFHSYRAMGRRLIRDTPELRRSREGVSVYDTIEAARATAMQYPRIGSFIAELEISEHSDVRFGQTLDDRHHFDLWGEPADRVAAVLHVHPV